MFKISADFRLKRETCHVAFNIFDRYMLDASIQKMIKLGNMAEQKIQEIAATCLYIAAK